MSIHCPVAGIGALVLAHGAAAQPFQYVSANRFVEGVADCGECFPPSHDEERVDAVGFEDFHATVHVEATDPFFQGASATGSQHSILSNLGITLSGSCNGEDGPPVGSAYAETYSSFQATFRLDTDTVVPFHVLMTQGYPEYGLGASLTLSGPGVDIHYDLFQFDAMLSFDGHIAFAADADYTLSVAVWAPAPASSVSYDVTLIAPAPPAAALLMFPLFIRPRRRHQ